MREGDLVPVRETWTVMATGLDVTVYRPASAEAQAAEDLAAAHQEVVAIDRMMSLYRPDSELVALNAKAGRGAIPVSAPLFEVLQAAEHYARLSGGAFDVTVQPLVELWGFYRVERAAIPPQDQIDKAMAQVGFTRVTLDAEARTATLEPGTRIDLGAIAKGYAVDVALAALRARGVPAALVNLGGNIGVLGRRPDGKPWSVGLQHPRENRLIGRIELLAGAVATSGDYDRYFEAGGKRYSHIIDPRTGWPVDGVYALTVAAPNATAADALSTAGFVQGATDGMTLLENCAGVAAVSVAPTDGDGPYAVRATSANRRDDAQIRIDPNPDVVVAPRDRTESGAETDCILPPRITGRGDTAQPAINAPFVPVMAMFVDSISPRRAERR
ncbi:MAG: FAD:protein FMN transferase [Rhodospirillaceae bacterium]|nr:FAD:protein FMN transferase [Rhodospirillaceae bacterium]